MENTKLDEQTLNKRLRAELYPRVFNKMNADQVEKDFAPSVLEVLFDAAFKDLTYEEKVRWLEDPSKDSKPAHRAFQKLGEMAGNAHRFRKEGMSGL